MKKWTKEEDEKIINFFKEGKKYSEICELLSVSDGTLRSRIKKLKITKKYFANKIKECLECNSEFLVKTSCKKDFKKKFCNNSCSAKYNNKMKKKKDYGNCLECKKKLDRKEKKFCNNKCQGICRSKNTFKDIENGNLNYHQETFKKYLIYKFGEKCMECGWCKVNNYTKKIPIQIEHIDGNSENNEIKNLKLLCPNCHSLTSTWGGANKGNGRSKRKENRQKIKKY
jgi:hypothetical protein